MSSRNLTIYCSQCKTYVFSYHKEGSGALLRVYLDRIIKPPKQSRQIKKRPSTKARPLLCPKCNKCIGLPIEKTPRRAWRLMPRSFFKKEK